MNISCTSNLFTFTYLPQSRKNTFEAPIKLLTNTMGGNTEQGTWKKIGRFDRGRTTAANASPYRLDENST